AVPERVLVKHRAVEKLLRLGAAGSLEMHLAEFAVLNLCESGLGQQNESSPHNRNCRVRNLDHHGYFSRFSLSPAAPLARHRIPKTRHGREFLAYARSRPYSHLNIAPAL